MGENLQIALVSGLISALVAGAFSIVSRFVDSRARRKDFFNTRKVDEYYTALDAYAALMDSLRGLGRSLSGRKDPDRCSSAAERREMINRDQAGAIAVNGVFDALKSARRVTLRLELLGAKRATADYQKIDETVNRYMREFVDDVQSTGVYKASKMRSLISEVDGALGELVNNARSDLGC